MNQQIGLLIEKIRTLEEELEGAFAKRAEELRIQVSNGRIQYSLELLKAHRAFKAGLMRYVFGANPAKILTAPVVYGLVIPLAFLDLFISVYQAVCFPIYGIPRVSRKDYLIFDRSGLAYLNLVEKINCAYCSYGNGLLAYAAEIAASTEQYWCPIKHAKRIKGAHPRYSRFFPYGDAEGYRKGLPKIRRELQPGEPS